jgi:hypothetical protein
VRVFNAPGIATKKFLIYQTAENEDVVIDKKDLIILNLKNDKKVTFFFHVYCVIIFAQGWCAVRVTLYLYLISNISSKILSPLIIAHMNLVFMWLFLERVKSSRHIVNKIIFKYAHRQKTLNSYYYQQKTNFLPLSLTATSCFSHRPDTIYSKIKIHSLLLLCGKTESRNSKIHILNGVLFILTHRIFTDYPGKT